MAAKALVQSRIDAGIRARAAGVIEELGLTVAQAIRIFLTKVADDGVLPFSLEKNVDKLSK